MKKVDLISDATYWRNNELFKAQFKIPLLVKLSFLQVRNYDLVNNHRKYVSRESIPGLIVKQQQSSRIFLYVSLVDCIAYLNPWALFENVRRGFKRFRAWNTGGGGGRGWGKTLTRRSAVSLWKSWVIWLAESIWKIVLRIYLVATTNRDVSKDKPKDENPRVLNLQIIRKKRN